MGLYEGPLGKTVVSWVESGSAKMFGGERYLLVRVVAGEYHSHRCGGGEPCRQYQWCFEN